MSTECTRLFLTTQVLHLSEEVTDGSEIYLMLTVPATFVGVDTKRSADTLKFENNLKYISTHFFFVLNECIIIPYVSLQGL